MERSTSSTDPSDILTKTTADRNTEKPAWESSGSPSAPHTCVLTLVSAHWLCGVWGRPRGAASRLQTTPQLTTSVLAHLGQKPAWEERIGTLELSLACLPPVDRPSPAEGTQAGCTRPGPHTSRSTQTAVLTPGAHNPRQNRFCLLGSLPGLLGLRPPGPLRSAEIHPRKQSWELQQVHTTRARLQDSSPAVLPRGRPSPPRPAPTPGAQRQDESPDPRRSAQGGDGRCCCPAPRPLLQTLVGALPPAPRQHTQHDSEQTGSPARSQEVGALLATETSGDPGSTCGATTTARGLGTLPTTSSFSSCASTFIFISIVSTSVFPGTATALH